MVGLRTSRFWAACLLTVGVFAVGCGGDVSASTTAQEGTVPATTERVYLATPLACSFVGTDPAQGTEFTPLEIRGPGYSTTIEPTEGCREHRAFTSYVYDVPAPASGRVEITPGNQPTATLDAAKLTRSGIATVFYGHEGQGEWRVTVYAKDEEVRDAP
jgi:hypothetical protein